VKLTVLGAGPAYSDRPGSTGAAYLLRSGRTSVLLDLGQGSFPALASLLEPSMLDGIVVSHLHPDHFIDLVSLRHYLVYQVQPPRRLRVYAPAGLGQRLDALHADDAFTSAAFDVTELHPGAFEIDGFRVDVAPVTHTPESDSFGFRVSEQDRADGLVYSGDCGRAADLEALIRPDDTLLAEVSFGPADVPTGAQHLNGPAVGELAARCAVRRVLLTHIQMGFDRGQTIRSVRDRYDGPVELVDPGFETEL
jgi:ribonuclease BN (tRNA processing enzyme)